MATSKTTSKKTTTPSATAQVEIKPEVNEVKKMALEALGIVAW